MLDHSTTEVLLSYDTIPTKVLVALHHTPAPAVRRQVAGPIPKHVAFTVNTETCCNNSDIVALGLFRPGLLLLLGRSTGRPRGVHSYNDPKHSRNVSTDSHYLTFMNKT